MGFVASVRRIDSEGFGTKGCPPDWFSGRQEARFSLLSNLSRSSLMFMFPLVSFVNNIRIGSGPEQLVGPALLLTRWSARVVEWLTLLNEVCDQRSLTTGVDTPRRTFSLWLEEDGCG